MEQYFTPGPVLAFILQWGMVAFSCFLVFSPFIYLGIRRWKLEKSVNVLHVIAAYILSIVIYYVWDWYLLNEIDKWIRDEVKNLGWVREIIYEAGYKMMFITTAVYILFPFCGTWLVRKKFSLVEFLIGLLISILLFSAIMYAWMYIIAIGLGSIGRDYF